jgi:transcriptional activator SPT8
VKAEPPVTTADALPHQSSNGSLDPLSNHKTQDADATSDASFDPLFDGEPDAEGEFDNENPTPDEFGAFRSQAPQGDGSITGNKASLAVPDAPNLGQQQAARSPQHSVAPPKNAPPLLDAANSSTFSPDILMIGAIDGQIMLWDKRVNTPGTGVGRLWMSEKTPPWCVSVRIRSSLLSIPFQKRFPRLVGPPTGRKFMLGAATERSMFGMSDRSVAPAHTAHQDY